MCACDPTNFDLVIVRDMADKTAFIRQWPEHKEAEFVFVKDVTHKLAGWIPTHIYFSVWCMDAINGDDEISSLLSHRKSRGSKIQCLGS